MKMRKILLAMMVTAIALVSAGVVAAQRNTPPNAGPFLGIRYEASDTGATVIDVLEASPAEEAGLQVDDVITAINEETVTGDNLADMINQYAPEDTIELTVTRGDETLKLEATLGVSTGRNMFTRPDTMRIRPFLGVRLENTDEGVVIVEVIPDSPAESIGLQAGDVIKTVNGQEVTNASEIAEAIASQQPSAQVMLTVLRDGETIELDVVLRALMPDMNFNVLPDNTIPREVIRPYLGVELVENEGGVEITNVAPDSPAQEAGLQTGDVITSLNSTAVAEPQDVIEIVSDMSVGDELDINVVRDDESLNITATLGQTVMWRFFREDPNNPMPNLGMPGMRDRSMMGNPNDFTYLEDESVWVVNALPENNPFYEAGLREDDRITEINGETYKSDDLDSFNFMFGIEDQVTLTVERDGETLEIEMPGVILPSLFMSANPMEMFEFDGNRFDFMPGTPNNRRIPRFDFDIMPEQPRGARLGVTYIMLDEQVADEFGIAQSEGALITDVAPGSPADNAGITADDVITSIDGEAINLTNMLGDVIASKQPGDVVSIDILRGNETVTLEVTLGQPERFGFHLPQMPDGHGMLPPIDNTAPDNLNLEREFSL